MNAPVSMCFRRAVCSKIEPGILAEKRAGTLQRGRSLSRAVADISGLGLAMCSGLTWPHRRGGRRLGVSTGGLEVSVSLRGLFPCTVNRMFPFTMLHNNHKHMIKNTRKKKFVLFLSAA